MILLLRLDRIYLIRIYLSYAVSCIDHIVKHIIKMWKNYFLCVCLIWIRFILSKCSIIVYWLKHVWKMTLNGRQDLLNQALWVLFSRSGGKIIFSLFNSAGKKKRLSLLRDVFERSGMPLTSAAHVNEWSHKYISKLKEFELKLLIWSGAQTAARIHDLWWHH